MPAFLLTLWPLLKRFWPFALGAALLVAVFWYREDARRWHKAYDTEHTARAADRAAVVAATAAAHAADLAHVQQVQAQDAAIAQGVSHDLETQLVAARSDTARYAGLHQCGTVARSSGSTSVSASTDAPDRTDAAGPAPVVDAAPLIGVSRADLDICSANTLGFEGMQSWARQTAVVVR